MSDRLLRELKLYREGYELRGRLLAAYRADGCASERVHVGLARVARELAALDTPEPQGAPPEADADPGVNWDRGNLGH